MDNMINTSGNIPDNKEKTVSKITPVTPRNHIGRNWKCPCGSGNKYKKCCLLKRVYTPGG